MPVRLESLKGLPVAKSQGSDGPASGKTGSQRCHLGPWGHGHPSGTPSFAQ